MAIPYSGARRGPNASPDLTMLVEDILTSGNNYGFRLSLQDKSK